MSPEEIQIIFKKIESKHSELLNLAKTNNNTIPKALDIAYFEIIKAIEDFSHDQNNALSLWHKRLNSALNVEIYEIELKAWKDKTNPDRMQVSEGKFVLKEDLPRYNAFLEKKKNFSLIIDELHDITINRILAISNIIARIDNEIDEILKRSDKELAVEPTNDGNLVSKEFIQYYEYITTYKAKLEEELKTGIATTGHVYENTSELGKSFNEERKQESINTIQIIKPKESFIDLNTVKNQIASITTQMNEIERKYYESKAIANNGMTVCKEDVDKYNFLTTSLAKYKEVLYTKFPGESITPEVKKSA